MRPLWLNRELINEDGKTRSVLMPIYKTINSIEEFKEELILDFQKDEVDRVMPGYDHNELHIQDITNYPHYIVYEFNFDAEDCMDEIDDIIAEVEKNQKPRQERENDIRKSIEKDKELLAGLKPFWIKKRKVVRNGKERMINDSFIKTINSLEELEKELTEDFKKDEVERVVQTFFDEWYLQDVTYYTHYIVYDIQFNTQDYKDEIDQLIERLTENRKSKEERIANLKQVQNEGLDERG